MHVLHLMVRLQFGISEEYSNLLNFFAQILHEGHLTKLEHTHKGLLVLLVNHYPTESVEYALLPGQLRFAEVLPH